MPLYQRPGSPFWWYSFTLNGVRFRGSTGTEDKRKARLIEAEAEAIREGNGRSLTRLALVTGDEAEFGGVQQREAIAILASKAEGAWQETTS